MLDWEMRADGSRIYKTSSGDIVGTISCTHKGEWLVETQGKYIHGTSTMWWKELKAAEFHILAIYEECK